MRGRAIEEDFSVEAIRFASQHYSPQAVCVARHGFFCITKKLSE